MSIMQSNVQLQSNPYQNSNSHFYRNWKDYPQIHMELQGALSRQNKLEIEEKSWKTHISQFQNLLQIYSTLW